MMELKAIDRTDRGVGRLNAALSIYRETILPEAQNPERQILYWIDHSRDTLQDEFKTFAIQKDGRVVGYLQYTYFCEEKIIFFEYFCLREFGRTGLSRSASIKCIEEHVRGNYPGGVTIVFEVAKTRATGGDWTADVRLIKYFKKLGFRAVDFAYRYPILQSYDGAISYPADLMVALPDGRVELKSHELRSIIRSIYFKHYLRWDRPFLAPEQFEKREFLINQLYLEQTQDIDTNTTFPTAGSGAALSLPSMRSLQPKISGLLEKIFGPKLPRITAVMTLLLAVQWWLGSSLMLIPFVLAVAAIYCLGEDTESSRKLLSVILSRLTHVRPRQ